MSASGTVQCPDGRPPVGGHVALYEEDQFSDDAAADANRWETDTDDQGDFFVEGKVEDGSAPWDGPIPEPYLWVTGRCAEDKVYSKELKQRHYLACETRRVSALVIVLTGADNSKNQWKC
ncbi:hypothetical protein AAVH_38291 [Aphelenchoides avenae]|nr:hypothetical protein AAVH_38291 [Aphelenchus avenae]